MKNTTQNNISDYIGVKGQKDIFGFTWNWGKDSLIGNFNPAEDAIDLSNFGTEYNRIKIYEDTKGNTVIDLKELNNQTITLAGIALSQLAPENLTGVSGQSPLAGTTSTIITTTPEPVVTSTPTSPSPIVNNNTTTSYVGVNGQKDTFSFTWDWGTNPVITNFNPAEDVIDLKNFWLDYSQFNIYEDSNGDTIVDLKAINNQVLTIQGVALSQLTRANITGVSGQSPLAGTPVTNPTPPTNPIVNPPSNPKTLWGNQFFAPYVDMTLYPTPDLDGIARQTGTNLFTVAFVQSDGQGNPAWAGLPALGLGSTNGQFQALGKEINQLRAIGGDVMLSIGGANGVSLAQTFTTQNKSANQLKNTYLSVVNEYGLTHLDFDIEGAAVSSPQSIKLRSEAISLLQQEKPSLNIWYTLPVLPSGLTFEGHNVVRQALTAGVNLDGINIMAMDYGDAAAPPQAASMGDYAIQAAQNTYSQLTSLYGQFGQTFGWDNLGVTPMIGVNDVTSEIFKPTDAQQLKTFAEQKGLGMLSMWSIGRDHPAPTGQEGLAAFNHSGLSHNSYTFVNIFGGYGQTTNPITV